MNRSKCELSKRKKVSKTQTCTGTKATQGKDSLGPDQAKQFQGSVSARKVKVTNAKQFREDTISQLTVKRVQVTMGSCIQSSVYKTLSGRVIPNPSQ